MRDCFLFPKTKIESENSWSLTQAWTSFLGLGSPGTVSVRELGRQEMRPKNGSCQVQLSKLPESANTNAGYPEFIHRISDLIMYSMVTVGDNTVLFVSLKFPRRVDLKCPRHTHTTGNYVRVF